MPRGVRFDDPQPQDLQKAQRWATALVAMAERRPDLAEEAGVTAADVEQARTEILLNSEIVVELPTAKAMYLNALAGRVSREEVLTRHHNTILAVHNLAAMAALVLAGKLDDHQAPGSSRVALEICKGTGILIPAEPIAARKRSELLDEETLRKKSDEELKAEVLDFT